MKLILHAGTHKTGTTSIQNVLRKNRIWLAQRGLYYPMGHLGWGGNREVPHHDFAHALADYHRPELMWAWGMLQEMHAHGLMGQTVIFSCEALYRHTLGDRGYAITPTFWADREAYLHRIARWFRHFEIRPILYFREPESFAVSLKHELTVNGAWAGGTMEEFRQHFAPWFDYERQIGLFRRVFGSVEVRSYDDAKHALIADFFNAIGFPVPEGADQEPWLRQRPVSRPVVEAVWKKAALAVGRELTNRL